MCIDTFIDTFIDMSHPGTLFIDIFIDMSSVRVDRSVVYQLRHESERSLLGFGVKSGLE